MPQPRQPLLSAAIVASLVLAAWAGCLVLLELSRFGQQPYAELPLPVVLMVGALASAPLAGVVRNLARRAALAATAASALLSLGLLLLPAEPFAPIYLLAPGSALALAWLFRSLPARLAAMLPAMTVYVVCTVLANYTFDSFVPVGGFFLVNVGTLFFGITFTQRDVVHRFGRRNVYAMILFAAVVNVLFALELGTELRYVAVGFLAILLSETADTEIYARLVGRPWLARVASSNAVSAPLDTLVFTLLAFAGQEFATPQWMTQVIVTDLLVKYGSGMVAALGLTRARLRASLPG